MKRKSMILFMTALGLVSVMASGCTKGGESQSTETSVESSAEPTKEVTEIPTPSVTIEPEAEEDIPTGMMKSYLTGEYVDEKTGSLRPYSFMIDNSSAANPQSSIASASLYYEAPVEGAYTRINAVFESVDGLTRIGPLRSCRDYFLSLTAGLDPIFVHYGQAAYALPYLESDEVDNISGLLSATNGCFFRDYTFHTGEHTAYIGQDGLEQAVTIRGYDTEHEKNYKGMYHFAWVGDEVTEDSWQDAGYVEPGYTYNYPSFTYNSEDGLYYRQQFGSAHVDAETGEQLAVTNIILEYQNYDIYQRNTIDHPVYLHFDTTAGGEGMYISHGKAIPITWERKSFWEPVKYYLEDGTELKMNTGKTWTCVIQNEYLSRCRIGADVSTAGCVVSDEKAAEAASYNAKWQAAYEATEQDYLSAMAAERDQYIKKHGGTKVEEGTVTNS